MSLEQKKIMVVKIGSSTLVTGEGKLDTAYLATLASQISGLRQRGWSPIIVTSGAVACGLEALGISTRPSDTPSLQAAASVGTNILVSSYARAFKAHDMGSLRSCLSHGRSPLIASSTCTCATPSSGCST